jgi:alkanesulfonate monooxygenase SsuD/methylene tetrahydromethanopterin reductase-like flavin-dependent oxidoreductase (luciferase family)
VDGAIVRPLPLQEGGIPIWIAGGGEKVTLRIAAEYANYTNFAGDPEGFDRKSALLREHCADAGTDFGAIVRSADYNTIVANTEAELADRIDAIEARVTPYLGEAGAAGFVAEYRTGNALAVGTPEQIIERFADMKRRGLEYSIHYFPEAAYDRSGMELFEREVMPALA